jgi:hypothetical protein
MALFPLSGNTIKGRVLASFPANVDGSGGISVTKTNGVWTIEPDWEDLTLITSSSVADTHQTWVWNPTTEVYSRVALSSIVSALGQAGAGVSLNFTADLTATSDADPGSGKLRFNNATQSSATVLYIDDADVNGLDITTLAATLDDSTATVKGQISLTKVGDATKRLIFNMTALTDASGYTKLTVSNIAASASNPFAEGDTVLFGFTRTGDSGSSSGDVTAAATFDVDNVLIRSDGTSKGVQKSGIVIADTTDNVSGVGTLDTDGKITVTIDDASNNTVTAAAKLSHTTSGTASAGIGVSLQLECETTAGNNEIGATIEAVTTDITSTSEDFDLVFKLMTAGAAAAEKFRVKSDGTAYLAADTGKILLHAEGNQNISEGGFTGASYNAGTKSSGTFTPDALSGNFQHCVNGGAFTLAPPTAVSSLILQITNGGSSGTITTSGFSKVNGDAFDTTSTSAFECVIRKLNSYSILTITKLA